MLKKITSSILLFTLLLTTSSVQAFAADTTAAELTQRNEYYNGTMPQETYFRDLPNRYFYWDGRDGSRYSVGLIKFSVGYTYNAATKQGNICFIDETISDVNEEFYAFNSVYSTTDTLVVKTQNLTPMNAVDAVMFGKNTWKFYVDPEGNIGHNVFVERTVNRY